MHARMQKQSILNLFHTGLLLAELGEDRANRAHVAVVGRGVRGSADVEGGGSEFCGEEKG